MKRAFFRAAEWLLLTLDELVAVGLDWIDRYYPDPDFNKIEHELTAPQPRHPSVTVGLPHHPSRRTH